MNIFTDTSRRPYRPYSLYKLNRPLKVLAIAAISMAAFAVGNVSLDADSHQLVVSDNRAAAQQSCMTSSGYAGDDGLKRWCWADLAAEINSLKDQSFIDDVKLFTSVHHYPDDTSGYLPVEVVGNQVVFTVSPRGPLSTTKPPRQGERAAWNYRSEIRDSPSDVDHPNGTEQWWGFNYTFGDDYIIDDLPWIMWQTHANESSPSAPMQALEVASANYGKAGNVRGEIVVANNVYFGSTGSTRLKTGVIPQAGQTLKVVIQMVWGTEATGLLRIWLDDVLVYDQQQRTSYPEHEEGGYWKAGIYKWRWQNERNIEISEALGSTRLQTSIGTMRVIKNDPDDAPYLTNQYAFVDPTQEVESTRFEMRFRGSTGSEKVVVRANRGGTQAAVFYATTSERTVATDFQLPLRDITSMQIDFDNDGYHNGADKNVYVDWIKLDGVRLETEDPGVYSTGTATRSTGCAPGYKRSPWLHCNGSLNYPISDDDGDTVAVRLRATTGTERIEMRSNNRLITVLEPTTRYFTSLTTLAAGQSLSDRIELRFVNDGRENGIDRNVQIDWIEVNGNRIEAEDPGVHSTGTYARTTGCAAGHKQSEWLHCNGAFTFQL